MNYGFEFFSEQQRHETRIENETRRRRNWNFLAASFDDEHDEDFSMQINDNFISLWRWASCFPEKVPAGHFFTSPARYAMIESAPRPPEPPPSIYPLEPCCAAVQPITVCSTSQGSSDTLFKSGIRNEKSKLWVKEKGNGSADMINAKTKMIWCSVHSGRVFSVVSELEMVETIGTTSIINVVSAGIKTLLLITDNWTRFQAFLCAWVRKSFEAPSDTKLIQSWEV